jgi:uncharacterized protein (TIGR03083 family)
VTAAGDPTRIPVGELAGAVLDQWRRVADEVATVTDWDGPTRLAGWTVHTLVAHMVIVGEAISRTLREAPTSDPRTGVYDVFRGAASRAIDNDRRAREGAASATGCQLVGRLHEAVAAAGDALAAVHPAAIVPTRFGALSVGDFLVHRIVEGVVHGLDLPRPTAPAGSALTVAVCAMVTLLRQSRPDLLGDVPTDPIAWLDVATGRAPAPAPLRQALPLLA